MNKYNCPKGMMKWTHRAIAIGILLILIGACVIIYPIIDNYKKDPETQKQFDIKNMSKFIISGAVLLVLGSILLFGSQISSIYYGCWKTALILYILPF